MNQFIYRLLNSLYLVLPSRNILRTFREHRERNRWVRRGGPVPPRHRTKQQHIKQVARTYKLRVLVESGTYYGDMVEAMKDVFDRIYSIEISNMLHKRAKKRFAGESSISLLQGDSAAVLETVVSRLDQPTLFWLDGHYCGGASVEGKSITPIWVELNHIFTASLPPYVIMIDDARLFSTEHGYPDIERIFEFIKSQRPDAQITIKHDCIVIIPDVETRQQARVQGDESNLSKVQGEN